MQNNIQKLKSILIEGINLF